MTPAAGAAVTLLLALAIDLALGDPPNRWHPVAWIGAALGAGTRRLLRGGPIRLFVAGGALTLVVAAGAGALAWAVERAAMPWGVAGILIDALVLKSLLSARGLASAARLVGERLRAGDLAGGRRALGDHLVSRPTGSLDVPRVASGAIESVAENLTDALVAPAAFYLAFGLAGAAVYRVVNTADAMIGYRDGPLEYFGKVAARTDDLLNLIPARLAALMIVAAAPFAGASGRGALTALRRDAGATESPNAGWPMAAVAGALNLTLEKPSAYRLGAGRLPEPDDIPRAIRVVAAAGALATLAMIVGRVAVGAVFGLS